MNEAKRTQNTKVVKAYQSGEYIMGTSKEVLEDALNDPGFRDADEIMILAYYKDADYYNFSKSGRYNKEKKLWHLEQWKDAVLRGDA